MNEIDIAVLFITVTVITAIGIWKTRGRQDLRAYLKGAGKTPWWAIGLSVMATQASAITFLSTPGQGYLNGLSFIQIYFGVPVALIIISIYFIPNFHRLSVYTAYEYLQTRFDVKTRLLGAFLFLLQRGIGAGLTIYAPAIVLSTVFGWSLPITIIGAGLLVTLYTSFGGTDAVTVTQRYQITVITVGMIAAALFVVAKLPPDLSFPDALTVAGGFQKLNAVSFSTDLTERYTIFSGVLGGTFLMLSYFGTDQSQAQRYLSGSSVRESRLGLLFNAIVKIPMQFFILMLGVLIFVFYQFEKPPLFFDETVNRYMNSQTASAKLRAYQVSFDDTHSRVKKSLESWIQAKKAGDNDRATAEFSSAAAAQKEEESIRTAATEELKAQNKLVKANNADYVFISFILKELPHGMVGLLVATFLLAALSSKAAELNALGASTTIDIYRLIANKKASDHECVVMSKWFTAFWGLLAIVFALFATLSENLIQAVNILGSIFYGVLLALFLVAFFIKRVGGTAMFWSALAAQILIFYLYFNLTISYLWLPLIGCAVCVFLSLAVQSMIGKGDLRTTGGTPS